MSNTKRNFSPQQQPISFRSTNQTARDYTYFRTEDTFMQTEPISFKISKK